MDSKGVDNLEIFNPIPGSFFGPSGFHQKLFNNFEIVCRLGFTFTLSFTVLVKLSVNVKLMLDYLLFHCYNQFHQYIEAMLGFGIIIQERVGLTCKRHYFVGNLS